MVVSVPSSLVWVRVPLLWVSRVGLCSFPMLTMSLPKVLLMCSGRRGSVVPV